MSKSGYIQKEKGRDEKPLACQLHQTIYGLAMCLQAWAELVAHVTGSRITASFQSVSGPQVVTQIAVSEQVWRNFLSDSYTILPTTYSLVSPPRRRPKISRTYRPISIRCSIRQVSFPIGQFTVVITPPRADREQLDRYPAGPNPGS
jgi:hypothetical protein